jgi:hypothetical protein
MTEQVRADEREAASHLPEAWRHVKAAGEELRRTLASVLPPDFHNHGRAARREALLAARSVIDAALDRIDKPASS